MTQKVLKVGSSAAVTIPKSSLEELGLNVGDRVVVEIDKKRRSFSVRPIFQTADKKLLDWTAKFIKRYKPALDALAKK